ncbi:MAG: hypothetical protein AAF934_03505 [Bacteroidota bacterium]
MKKVFLFLSCMLVVQQSIAQVNTAVFTLDLSVPKENALTGPDGTNRLVFNAKELLAFKLKNANPYKYRYEINSELVNFFEGDVAEFFTKIENFGKSEENAVGKKFKKNSLEIDDFKKVIEKEQLKRTDEMKDLHSKIENYLLDVVAEDHLNRVDFVAKRKALKSRYDTIVSAVNSINELSGDDCTKQRKAFEEAATKVKTVLTKMFSLKLDHYLLPIDVGGKNIDVVRITVKRYNKSEENQASDEHTYTIWVKGGFKIDVSAGIFATSLVDRDYFTTDTVINEDGIDQTYQLIHEKNTGDYAYGFGTMLNTTFRTGTWIRPTVNFGAIFNQDQKFQLLFGGGIIIGKEERIVLHGGLAMGSVTTLLDRYRADGTTPYSLSTDDNIPTVEKFSFGHFFGITYNFGKPRAQEK